ncbi:hypothetical protein L2E82_19294 [Cichorium intybus]|uniref:Uncharacterized protein n=1 Tax=Cichorium intybus TaxID=13427 RepID=A0ACB9FB33_CICIN|nr:hypothetical protein L2E82_19294 [Cichorium intybus]
METMRVSKLKARLASEEEKKRYDSLLRYKTNLWRVFSGKEIGSLDNTFLRSPYEPSYHLQSPFQFFSSHGFNHIDFFIQIPRNIINRKYSMAGVQDSLEIKFLLNDGSVIGPTSFPVDASIESLKQSIISQWTTEKDNAPRTVENVKLINGGKILKNNTTVGEWRVALQPCMYISTKCYLLKKKWSNPSD